MEERPRLVAQQVWLLTKWGRGGGWGQAVLSEACR